MTQSSPIEAPAPIVTLGYTVVRAPIDAPAPTATNGPIDTSGAIAASPAIAACRSMPCAGGAPRVKKLSARANAAYGFAQRSVAQPRGAGCVTSRPTITADAFVVESWLRYLPFERKLKSPACAASRPA